MKFESQEYVSRVHKHVFVYVHMCKILDALFTTLSVMHPFQSIVHALQAADSLTPHPKALETYLNYFSINTGCHAAPVLHNPFEALSFMYNLRLTKACSWHMVAWLHMRCKPPVRFMSLSSPSLKLLPVRSKERFQIIKM